MNSCLTEEKELEIAQDIETGIQLKSLCRKHEVPAKEIRSIATKFDLTIGVAADPKKQRKKRSVYGVSNFPKDWAITYSDWLNRKITKVAICKKYDISAASCARMINKWKENHTDNVSKINTAKDKEKEIYVLSRDTVIEVGLVADRHEMPVDRFIFGSISHGQVNDFSQLKRVAEHFIKTNVKFDSKGYAINSIRCYCTGLQSALNAFIVACVNNKVNYSLMHYDTCSGRFLEQEGIMDFKTSDQSAPQALSGLYRWYDEIRVNNTHPLNVIRNDEIFAVARKVNDGNGNYTKSVLDIFALYDDALNFFIKLASDIRNTEERTNVFLNRLVKENVQFRMEQPSLMQSQNYFIRK